MTVRRSLQRGCPRALWPTCLCALLVSTWCGSTGPAAPCSSLAGFPVSRARARTDSVPSQPEAVHLLPPPEADIPRFTPSLGTECRGQQVNAPSDVFTPGEAPSPPAAPRHCGHPPVTSMTAEAGWRRLDAPAALGVLCTGLLQRLVKRESGEEPLQGPRVQGLPLQARLQVDRLTQPGQGGHASHPLDLTSKRGLLHGHRSKPQ